MILKAVLSCFLLSPLVSALTDQQEVKVKPEQDVALQCRAPRGSSITLVEWNRADLKSDGYVFFYRNKRSYDNFQHPSFHGRVKLRDPEMKDGDASVVLMKVSVNDTGTYDCQIIVVDAGRAEATPPEIKHLIRLTVTDPDGNVWSGVNVAAAAVGSLVVVVVVVVIVVVVCRKCKRGGWMA
ncbi:myelin protein zero-like protein 2 [Chaetodon trifascialis]|uniref:myelin protein zero-like protein 2 n=1 Tax=Chaetodon trifascialis TaxID=109706 RepID=UPI003992AAD6